MKAVLIILLAIYSFSTFAQKDGTILFVEGVKDNENWTDFSSNDEFNVRRLIELLVKSPVGRSLIKKAKIKAEKQNKTIEEIIVAGKGSITDTTLVRRFSASDPTNVSYESRSKVIINSELNDYDAILDLAHELTHYIFRENFNPYLKNFSLEEFIHNTIEGNGGEVHAFITECKVLNELFPKKISSRYNCKKITDAQGKISFNMAKEHFYKVGSHFTKFDRRLKEYGIGGSFPTMSEDKATFISSAYGTPYPVAAFYEYVTVLKKVCDNDKKRLGYLNNKIANRSPASNGKPAKHGRLYAEYHQKCDDVDQFQID